ncbi:hypothetical protein [Larkinella harenae]
MPLRFLFKKPFWASGQGTFLRTYSESQPRLKLAGKIVHSPGECLLLKVTAQRIFKSQFIRLESLSPRSAVMMVD